MDVMDIILFTFTSYIGFTLATSDKHESFLPMYEMDDYLSCLEEDNFYCKFVARLKNDGNGNNSVWNLIQDSVGNKSSYDRSIIHRAVCLPKKGVLNLGLKNYSQLLIHEKIKEMDLLASVENVSCTTKDEGKFYFYEKFLMFFFASYLCLTLYATIYDKRKKKTATESTGDKVLISLSLTSNLRKICNTKGNEDYSKLKSIQGIRFYNMLSIIALHTFVSYNFVELSNPDALAKQLGTFDVYHLTTLAVFLVHTFFLMSSWILTFQIYNIYKDHGKFTAKQAFILVINRFLRIEVCLSVVTLVLTSSWTKVVNGPITFDTTEMIQEACKYNWWQTLFLINNHLDFGDICQPASWYLSVDFHMYIMTTITIYLILKYNLDEFKTISFLVVFSCFLYGSIIYFTEMDIIYRTTPNSLKKFILFQSAPLRILYNSTFSNWTTSLVGISLGIVYTKNKNREIINEKNRRIMSVLWFLIFLGLPSAVIFVAEHEFEGFQAAILGPLVKPLFSLGIGIGILGMSHNIGGVIKWICENKFVLLMSNFSFCTYVFHDYLIFAKGFQSYSLMKFDPIDMVKSFVFVDALGSIMIGFICTLLFEQPGVNLQKIFLPQITRTKKQPKED